MFGVPFLAKTLMKAATGSGIKTNFNHDLVAIDGSAQDFIKKNPLTTPVCWVDLNGKTLQHNKYNNVHRIYH